MDKKIISNQPPKGTFDWLPEEFLVRKYIFDTWRKVCLRYGYEEYLTPLLESADVYRAKSGEDIGGKELMVFTDRGGRELSIRPEMTPSVTRMVTKIYTSKQKPLRLFSIANFVRNEKPQRGRNREFWQLNFDCFGSESLNSDIEIMQIALDIMLEFGASKKSFVLYINNRKLIDGLLDGLLENLTDLSKRTDIVRIMDKYEKLSLTDFSQGLKDLGLEASQINSIASFMGAKDLEDLLKKLPWLAGNPGLTEIQKTMEEMEALGYGKLVEFKPNIIRGFDYYNGLIFEVFDCHEENKRAMFGGGRYDGLAGIFGGQPFPAAGCAPGDETTKLFLESWGLLDGLVAKIQKDKGYLPLLSADLSLATKKLAKRLRKVGWEIEQGLEPQKIGKALEIANKKGLGKVIIYSTDEIAKGICKIKDMETGLESELVIEKL